MPAWAVLFSTVSTLLAVYLGSRLSNKADRRQWLRDVELETFSKLTSSARSVLWRAADIGAEPQALDEQRARLRDALFTFREALAAVTLTSPQTVLQAANALEGHLGNALYPHFMALTAQPTEDGVEVTEGRRLLTDFQEIARVHVRAISDTRNTLCQLRRG